MLWQEPNVCTHFALLIHVPNLHETKTVAVFPNVDTLTRVIIPNLQHHDEA